MRQAIGAAWSPVGLAISASCGPVPCTLMPITCPLHECGAQVSATASATGREPSGRRVRETHLHAGVDHRHKHHQGQQQETGQVETQHEQGAGGGGERRVRRNCTLEGRPRPTVCQESARHLELGSQGRPTAPSFPLFPKKSSCSKGPRGTVLQYSPLPPLPLSDPPSWGTRHPQGANGAN